MTTIQCLRCPYIALHISDLLFHCALLHPEAKAVTYELHRKEHDEEPVSPQAPG